MVPPFVRMTGSSTLITADEHAVAVPLPPQEFRKVSRLLPLGGVKLT